MATKTSKPTKARTSSKKTNLKSANKFNANVAIVVVGLLSVLGIYLVWQSFAAEPTSKYDASNYTHCKYFNNIPSTPSGGLKASELPTDGGTWCWERNLKYGLSGKAPSSEVLARKAALAEWDKQHPAEWCRWQPDTNPPTNCDSTNSTTPEAETSSPSSTSTPATSQTQDTATPSTKGTTATTKSSASPKSKSTGATPSTSKQKTDGTR